jgi:hypothetical protein
MTQTISRQEQIEILKRILANPIMSHDDRIAITEAIEVFKRIQERENNNDEQRS